MVGGDVLHRRNRGAGDLAPRAGFAFGADPPQQVVGGFAAVGCIEGHVVGRPRGQFDEAVLLRISRRDVGDTQVDLTAGRAIRASPFGGRGGVCEEDRVFQPIRRNHAAQRIRVWRRDGFFGSDCEVECPLRSSLHR